MLGTEAGPLIVAHISSIFIVALSNILIFYGTKSIYKIQIKPSL